MYFISSLPTLFIPLFSPTKRFKASWYYRIDYRMMRGWQFRAIIRLVSAWFSKFSSQSSTFVRNSSMSWITFLLTNYLIKSASSFIKWMRLMKSSTRSTCTASSYSNALKRLMMQKKVIQEKICLVMVVSLTTILLSSLMVSMMTSLSSLQQIKLVLMTCIMLYSRRGQKKIGLKVPFVILTSSCRESLFTVVSFLRIWSINLDIISFITQAFSLQKTKQINYMTILCCYQGLAPSSRQTMLLQMYRSFSYDQRYWWPCQRRLVMLTRAACSRPSMLVRKMVARNKQSRAWFRMWQYIEGFYLFFLARSQPHSRTERKV